MIEVQTFSPLGEVRFSERSADGSQEPAGPAVVSSPPAVRSRGMLARAGSAL
jgi:hypothetical protein